MTQKFQRGQSVVDGLDGSVWDFGHTNDGETAICYEPGECNLQDSTIIPIERLAAIEATTDINSEVVFLKDEVLVDTRTNKRYTFGHSIKGVAVCFEIPERISDAFEGEKKTAVLYMRFLMSEVSSHKESNPGLHALYVKTAVEHLTLLDGILKVIGNTSNINMMDVGMAVQNERAKLLRTNHAYADAQEILDGIKNAKRKLRKIRG